MLYSFFPKTAPPLGLQNQAFRATRSQVKISRPITAILSNCAIGFTILVLVIWCLGPKGIGTAPPVVGQAPLAVSVVEVAPAKLSAPVMPVVKSKVVLSPKPVATTPVKSARIVIKAPIDAEQRTAMRLAKQKTDQLAQIDQADLNTLKWKGYAALRKGNFGYAVPAFTRAVRLAPNDATVRQYLAYALTSSGAISEALSQHSIFEQLKGIDVGERIHFGTLLADSTDREPAQNYFSDTIRYCSNPHALMKVEHACETLGFRDQAEDASLKAVKAGATDDQLESIRFYQRVSHSGGIVAQEGMSKMPKIND